MRSQAIAAQQPLRLYHDLADWYPLLTPVCDYAEEAAFYRRQFEAHCRKPPRSLLDLGSGGGHNAAYLKSTLACTLVDVSPDMLALSRRLNPDCEHVQGDMRSLRLGRVFDCVLVHDAVSYMSSRDDLGKAIACAFAHCAAGGVALFQPDFVAETFAAGTETGGSDAGDRAVRYLEWRWDPDPKDTTYVTDMVYLLRDAGGVVEVIHESEAFFAVCQALPRQGPGQRMNRRVLLMVSVFAILSFSLASASCRRGSHAPPRPAGNTTLLSYSHVEEAWVHSKGRGVTVCAPRAGGRAWG